MEAIIIAYAQALIIDRKAFNVAQEKNNFVTAQEILKKACRTYVSGLVTEARLSCRATIDPFAYFSVQQIRSQLIKYRVIKDMASGLQSESRN